MTDKPTAGKSWEADDLFFRKTFKMTVVVTVDMKAYNAEYGETFTEDEVREDIEERIYEGMSSNLYSLVQVDAVTDYGIKGKKET